MYHISTITDILRQRVDPLAQWLEHWISKPTVRVRIPSGTWDFFFKLCIISYLRVFIIVRWGLVGDGPFESYSHKYEILVIISHYSLEMGDVMSHCTTKLFEIICRGWKVGMADHMMHSFFINSIQ